MVSNRFLRFSRARPSVSWVKAERDLEQAVARTQVVFDRVDGQMESAIKRLKWPHTRDVVLGLEIDALTVVDAFERLEVLEIEGAANLAQALLSFRAPSWLGLSMPTIWPQSPSVAGAFARLGVQGFYAVSKSETECADLVHHLQTICANVKVLSIDASTGGCVLPGVLPRLRELDLSQPRARLPAAPQLEKLKLKTTKLEAVAEPLPCLRELVCLGDINANDWPLLTPSTLWRLACYTLPAALHRANLEHLKELTLHEVNDSLLTWLVDQAALPEIQVLVLPQVVSERMASRLLERFGATLISFDGPCLGREAFDLLLAGCAPVLSAMSFRDLSEADFRRLRSSALAQRLTTLEWIGRLDVESVEALLDPRAFPSLKCLRLDGERMHLLPRELSERVLLRFGQEVFP